MVDLRRGVMAERVSVCSFSSQVDRFRCCFYVYDDNDDDDDGIEESHCLLRVVTKPILSDGLFH